MSFLIARNGFNGNLFDVELEDIPCELKNKRIIIESLDNSGQVVETNTLNAQDKDSMLCALVAIKGNLSLSTKKYFDHFSSEELEIIKDLILRFNFFLTSSKVTELKAYFEKHSIEKIKFALDMSDYRLQGNYYFINTKHKLAFKKFDYTEAMTFIENREGIYYAIDNNGEKTWDFIDKPSKKQAQYQRKKNGNRIAFLSFQSWKEYIISEEDLS